METIKSTEMEFGGALGAIWRRQDRSTAKDNFLGCSFSSLIHEVFLWESVINSIKLLQV